MPVLDLVDANGTKVGTLRGDANGNLFSVLKDSTPSGTTAERDAAYPAPTGNETWDNTTLGYRQWYNAASAQWEKDSTLVNGALPTAQINATSGVAVTPSDSVPVDYSSLYIGGGGNLAVLCWDDVVPITFTAVPVGTVISNLRVKRVMATNTTATLILGF